MQKIVVIMLFSWLLIACGQTGELYLPEQSTETGHTSN